MPMSGRLTKCHLTMRAMRKMKKNLHGMCFYLYLCSEILRKTENKD